MWLPFFDLNNYKHMDRCCYRPHRAAAPVTPELAAALGEGERLSAVCLATNHEDKPARQVFWGQTEIEVFPNGGKHSTLLQFAAEEPRRNMAAEARGAPQHNPLAKEHQEEDRALGSGAPNYIPDLGPVQMFWRKWTVHIEEDGAKIPPSRRATDHKRLFAVSPAWGLSRPWSKYLPLANIWTFLVLR